MKANEVKVHLDHVFKEASFTNVPNYLAHVQQESWFVWFRS